MHTQCALCVCFVCVLCVCVCASCVAQAGSDRRVRPVQSDPLQKPFFCVLFCFFVACLLQLEMKTCYLARYHNKTTVVVVLTSDLSPNPGMRFCAPSPLRLSVVVVVVY